jgi:hypothetical protein
MKPESQDITGENRKTEPPQHDTQRRSHNVFAQSTAWIYKQACEFVASRTRARDFKRTTVAMMRRRFTERHSGSL